MGQHCFDYSLRRARCVWFDSTLSCTLLASFHPFPFLPSLALTPFFSSSFPPIPQVLTALHSTGTTTLAVASRAPNTQAAVHMLQLMKMHAFFLSSPSSSTSSSSPSSSVVVETGEEEAGKEGENKLKSTEMLMHISNEGFGKTKHLREILR